MDLLLLIINIHFYKYLSNDDFLNIILLNKLFNKLKKKEFIWKYYCIVKFNKKFWDDALLKNSKNSLGSWRKEYIRIIKFENTLKKYKHPIWKIKDYYNWWEIKNIKI